MKVIKAGKDAQSMVYRGTCYRCSAEVEFERREAQLIHDQRDGDFLQVMCPWCAIGIIQVTP